MNRQNDAVKKTLGEDGMRMKQIGKTNFMYRFARVGLVLVLTMIFGIFLIHGGFRPKEAEAAIAELNAWPATPQINNVTASPATTSFTPAAGSNRIIVVSVHAHTNNTTATTITASYGGVAARAIVNSPNNQRRQNWLFYLNESDISAASGTTLSVTSNNVGSGLSVYIATLSGVDQTSTIVATPYSVYSLTVTYSFNVLAGGYAMLVSTDNTATDPTNDEGYTGSTSEIVGAAYSYLARKTFASAATTSPVYTTDAGFQSFASFAVNPVLCSDTNGSAVTITNPTNGSSVGGTISLAATLTNAATAEYSIAGGAWTPIATAWNTLSTHPGSSSAPVSGVTVDVRAVEDECGGYVTHQVTVTVDNTCSDGDPTTGVTVTPTSGAVVNNTVTVQATIAGEATPGAPGASASVTITGSDSCNVSAQAMTWNSGNSRWEYSWDTSACGLAAEDTGVSISVDYTDPDCSVVTNGISSNITINNMDPSKLASCGSCHSYPPLDGARSGATGAVAGSHQPHNKPAYTCDTCHVAPGSTGSGDFGHRDGTITMQPSIQGGAYTGGTHAQTNTPSLTNCSTNNCHGGASGNTPTPVWGGTTPGCITCHNGVVTALNASAVTGGAVTQRDAVKLEFGLAWGHKKSGRGAVADADCIVCHLEGDYATQQTSSKHADGYIDLRDPDGAGETAITDNSGGAFTFVKYSISYAAGSRTTTLGNTVSEVITVKFCIACHDNNGATNTTARSNNGGTGTAAMPFGGIGLGANYTAANGAIGTQGLVDVATQFASTNSSRHPVGAPNSRAYPYSTKLLSPYDGFGTARNSNTLAGNTASPRVKANSVVLVCDDCHTTGTSLTSRTITAHGNATGLRGTYYATGPTLCLTCHIGTYNDTTNGRHNTGSAFSVGTTRARSAMDNCEACHFSKISAATAPRPIKASDIHGFNNMLGTSAGWTYGAANGMRPIAFLRNNSSFVSTSPRPYTATVTGPGQFNLAAGQSTCGGNGSIAWGSCNDNHTNYSPGGSY